MLNKEVTRKEFLLSIASFAGLLMISGVPKKLLPAVASMKENREAKNFPAYGASTYGSF